MAQPKIDLTCQVYGMLPAANGGTGGGLAWPSDFDGGTFDPPGSPGTLFNFDGGVF